MQAIARHAGRRGGQVPRWLKRMGAVGFMFFLAKGLAWLAAGAWLVL